RTSRRCNGGLCPHGSSFRLVSLAQHERLVIDAAVAKDALLNGVPPAEIAHREDVVNRVEQVNGLFLDGFVDWAIAPRSESALRLGAPYVFEEFFGDFLRSVSLGVA